FARNQTNASQMRGTSVILKKVDVVDLKQHPSPCDQYLGNSMFFWVPNPSYDRKQQKKRTQCTTSAQHVTVQEISFQGQPFDQQKQSQKIKKKASDSVPTGGQPYTFLARQQQILKGLKDTMKGKAQELAELNQSGSEGRDSKKISAYFVPAPVSKKFALRNLTEKQQEDLSNTHFKMDGKYLKGKKMNIIQLGTLEHHKYFSDKFSSSRKIISGFESRPSPSSFVEGEWAEQCIDLLGRDFQMTSTPYSNLSDNIQYADVTSDGKIEAKDIVDIRTDAERGLSLDVSVEPGDEIQIAKRTQEQDLSTAPEKTDSEDQNSLPVAERNEQEFLSTITEISPLSMEQIRSDDQSNVPETSEQDDRSTIAAMRSSSVEQIHSDIGLSVTERGEQVNRSTFVAMRSSSVEQIHSDIGLAVTARSEQNDRSTIVAMRSSSVEQIHSDIGLSVTERSEQEDHSSTEAMRSSSVEQIHSDTGLSVTERGEQVDRSTIAAMRSSSVEQIHSDTGLSVTERSEQEDRSTTAAIRSSSVEQIHSDIGLSVTARSEQNDRSTIVAMRSSSVEQIHSDIGFSVTERNKQEFLSTETEIRSPRMVQSSEISLSVTERSEPEFLTTSTEMGHLNMGLSGVSLAVAAASEQEFLSTSEEMGSLNMGQIHSKFSLSIASDQEDYSITTESSGLSIEQGNRKSSEDHQSSTAIAKSVEDPDEVAPNERSPSDVGEMDLGGPKD
ncbi:hypothetical protein scyTo_0018161, partial [Scyliorhinus torazame]|nr:hypothetical protein [Scyliorhinus torazame]